MHRTLIIALFTLLIGIPAVAAPTWDNGTSLTRIVSRYYHADPVVVISVGQDTHEPLDVLVTFELARLSSTAPLQIHKLRLGGAHWADIMAQRGIQPQSLQSGLSPLPHSLDRLAHQPALYDQDVRELVGLRVASGVLAEPVASVTAQRNAGAGYVSMLLGGR